MDRRSAAHLIERIFPPLRVEQITGPRSGTDNDCFLINNEWIFRFPKSAEAADLLCKETVFLDILHQQNLRLSAIPRFLYRAPKSSGFPHGFVGYRRIRGQPLQVHILEKFSDRVRSQIAQQVAGLLRGIHKAPVDSKLACWTGTPEQAFEDQVYSLQIWINSISDCLQRASSMGLYGPDYSSLRTLFDRLQGLSHEARHVCLIHGDLSEEHLLISEDLQQLAGIIDFGNVRMGDAVEDFIMLTNIFGQSFCGEVAHFYGQSMSLARIRHVQEMIYLISACRRLLKKTGFINSISRE